MCCRYLDLFLYSDLIVNSDTHQGKGEGEGGQPAKGKGDGQRQSIGRNNNKPGICSFKYVWVLKKTVSCWSLTIAVTGYLQICYNIVLFGNCSSLHIICRNCVYTFLFLQLIYFHSPIEISSINDTTLLSLQQHIMGYSAGGGSLLQ